jgi:hypothetical protein
VSLIQWCSPVLALALVCSGASPVSAQTTTDERVWLGLSLQARPQATSPWRGVLESQVRSRDGLDALEQWYVRPSVAYDLSTHSSVWIGYAFFRTTPASGGALTEHRLWQQFLWTHPAAGGTFTSRSRLEQRSMEGNDHTAWRIRQQLRLSRPIRPRSEWSILVWDEFAVHLNQTRRTARGFDQNRAFVGMGLMFKPRARVEFGYQNQFVYSHLGAHRLNHILSAVLAITLR